MKGRRGGRPNPFGHVVKTKLEGRVCEELSSKGVPHDHDVPPFTVVLDSGRRASYSPDIMVAYEGNTIFINCISSYRRGDPRIRKIKCFKRENGKIYHTIIAAPSEVAKRLPKESYDDLMIY
ncbi:MAG TPA: hypothetical protein VMS77_08530 [Conexivisphaerales archaeon]|nr:hypothetical protein [Conexivisphaerales archaeon]